MACPPAAQGLRFGLLRQIKADRVALDSQQSEAMQTAIRSVAFGTVRAIGATPSMPKQPISNSLIHKDI